MQSFLFFFCRWDLVCRPRVLAKTVETGDKNCGDFHSANDSRDKHAVYFRR